MNYPSSPHLQCPPPPPPPPQRQLLYGKLCRTAPCSVSALSHCQDEKRRSGGGLSPQEQCLAGAYYGFPCPNKHTGTSQPQLWASPWLTSSPVSPPLVHRNREKTSEEERDDYPRPKLAGVREAKTYLFSDSGLSHACRPAAGCVPACQKSVQLTHPPTNKGDEVWFLAVKHR